MTNTNNLQPLRGEIWTIDLNPVKGHEQAGKRPCLIVSDDRFNDSFAGLAMALPITTKRKKVPWHVRVAPPEGGLRKHSYIKCEDLRSLSVNRLGKRMGAISRETMLNVEDKLKILLDL